MPSLLDRRLLVVLGKGGVGKTTVTGALALAAARRGKRVLAVEVASQHRLARLFADDAQPSFDETPLYPGLTGVSIDPQQALEEYLVLAVRVRAIAERIAESKGLGYVAAAAPGLREIVTLGKVWHLSEARRADGGLRHELVVLDAPATGHGIGLLKTPRQFMEIARVGRVHEEARSIAALLEDRERTAIVLVTLAEEMPVAETIDARGRLRELGLDAELVVVNALYPERFADGDADALRGATPLGPTGVAAARAALAHVSRQREQAAELAQLREAIPDLPLVRLPFLFRPSVDLEGMLQLAEAAARSYEERP